MVTGKKMTPGHRAALVEDIERGVATEIRPAAWQTDTCIGSWHYSRAIAEKNSYKTVDQVVHMLLDIVSKNGNLMLSIPVRGDGTIDEHEIAFLDGLTKWMDVNGEGIFASRPWKVYGEGPSTLQKAEAGQFGGARDVPTSAYTSADVRFTTKNGSLYAFLLGWPADLTVTITSLATASALAGGRAISAVSLLGHQGPLQFTQDARGLVVSLPNNAPSQYAVALKIEGAVS